jgi:hypothetical protein
VIIPHNAPPPPTVKHVTTTQYGEAKLIHDVMSVCSVSDILHMVISSYCILHMVNKTTRKWCFRKQATALAATCGLEFGATQICVEQIIELRNSLSYLGVPIPSKIHFFGDNKLVVDSSIHVHAKLADTALSYCHF